MKYQVIIIGGGPAGYTAAESAGKEQSRPYPAASRPEPPAPSARLQ